MKPGWIAGVTRARLLLSRSIGPEHARLVARSSSLADGLAALAGSAYGERARAGQDLAAAQRSVADTLLWHLRILAGWLPAAGGALVRALAGWFELANIDGRLAVLAGGGAEPTPFTLGALGTAWQAASRARTVEDLAEALAESAWDIPRGHSPAELSIALRVAWGTRVQESAPEAADWVAGAAALLVARERILSGSTEHMGALRRLPDIDERALAAGTLPDLREAVGARAGWALTGIGDATELWRAELGWWDRLEDDARAMLRRIEDEAVVLAAIALMAVDARRTARALQSAAESTDAPDAFGQAGAERPGGTA